MVELDGEELTPEVAAGLLESLRSRGPDQQFINHDGEHVWLGFLAPRASMPRGGCMDCCFVGEECDYHARLLAGAERDEHHVITWRGAGWDCSCHPDPPSDPGESRAPG